MSTLSPAAIGELAAAGITPAEWIAYGGRLEPVPATDGTTRWVPSTVWGGDVCGCTDDRCVGHHHGENEPCGCLPALIGERAQKREAHALWAQYQAAIAVNEVREDPDVLADATARAAAWVHRHYPAAVTFSLDTPVKGQAGITVVYPGADPGYVGSAPDPDGWRMLVWSAGTDANGHIRAASPHE